MEDWLKEVTSLQPSREGRLSESQHCPTPSLVQVAGRWAPAPDVAVSILAWETTHSRKTGCTLDGAQTIQEAQKTRSKPTPSKITGASGHKVGCLCGEGASYHSRLKKEGLFQTQTHAEEQEVFRLSCRP